MGARCFGKMSRVSCGCCTVATLTYAAAVWYKRVRVHAVRIPLLRTLRPALTLLTKAYRYVSTPALAVLAGVLPADLEIMRAGLVCEEGVNKNVKEMRALRSTIYERVRLMWQERWEAEDRGGDLRMFSPA